MFYVWVALYCLMLLNAQCLISTLPVVIITYFTPKNTYFKTHNTPTKKHVKLEMSVIGQAPASVIWRSFKYVLAVCNSSLLLTTLVPLSHLQHTWFWSVSSMPRCFMAKKLKYPYQQWKSQTRPETDAENDIAPTPGSYHQLASISRSEPGLFFMTKASQTNKFTGKSQI